MKDRNEAGKKDLVQDQLNSWCGFAASGEVQAFLRAGDDQDKVVGSAASICRERGIL